MYVVLREYFPDKWEPGYVNQVYGVFINMESAVEFAEKKESEGESQYSYSVSLITAP